MAWGSLQERQHGPQNPKTPKPYYRNPFGDSLHEPHSVFCGHPKGMDLSDHLGRGRDTTPCMTPMCSLVTPLLLPNIDSSSHEFSWKVLQTSTELVDAISDGFDFASAGALKDTGGLGKGSLQP